MPGQDRVNVAPGTIRRLESVGAPLSMQEVLRFLIEEGLAVIQQRRRPAA